MIPRRTTRKQGFYQLIYPYFNKRFYIHIDASELQPGAVIIQTGKPIKFYSRKLTKLQQRYIVTEKE